MGCRDWIIHASKRLARPGGYHLEFAALNKPRSLILARGACNAPANLRRTSPSRVTDKCIQARKRRIIMYAVIESGGKQHRVQEGEVLKLEKLEVATGETLNFDKVLLVGAGGDVQVGSTYLVGSTVSAEVLQHGRHDKVRIMKFRRRKHYKRETGHRQWFTEVRITGISAA